jgi:hypothetical protein
LVIPAVLCWPLLTLSTGHLFVSTDDVLEDEISSNDSTAHNLNAEEVPMKLEARAVFATATAEAVELPDDHKLTIALHAVNTDAQATPTDTSNALQG